MKALEQRLQIIREHIINDKIKVMIIGLGSVGAYLLDYLISKNDPAVSIVVVGREEAKMRTKVNIIRVAGLIREVNKSGIEIEGGIDFNDVDALRHAIEKHQPDFIVNSSRAYPGLKYGSISWEKLRAYGIWSPLAMLFTRNVMEACDKADTNAIVINTSYSDAVIAWMKSAGKAYPDFGSGNLNHLIPRIKFAVADMLGVQDYWNVDVMIAAGHFHDVCISKEGQTEGVELPLKIYYQGTEQEISPDRIFAACKIPMPADQTRNMMNASSNYQIICAVIDAVRTKGVKRIFSPGFGGNVGGYPVLIGYKEERLSAWIDETVFRFDEMNKTNKASMTLDGVEDVADGRLIYTDELIGKVRRAFDVILPKTVPYQDIDKTVKFIIDNIISKTGTGGVIGNPDNQRDCQMYCITDSCDFVMEDGGVRYAC